MKKFIILTLALTSGITNTINAMSLQPLPYHSPYSISESTRMITNPEHKTIVANFMHMCAWVPEASDVLYLGNELTNGGYYDPRALYELLKETIPAMIRARDEFARLRDFNASRALGIFAIGISQSFLALKKAAGISEISETEELVRETFHLH